ncbi:hypothetical protein B0H10DRAFT_2098716, partial [Mycena sp. CBHHK59/15]
PVAQSNGRVRDGRGASPHHPDPPCTKCSPHTSRRSAIPIPCASLSARAPDSGGQPATMWMWTKFFSCEFDSAASVAPD